MVTRDTPYLTTDIFPVVKMIFPLLFLGWYLFRVVSNNGYLTRGGNANAHSIATNGNVSVTGWVIPLVTVPFSDLLMKLIWEKPHCLHCDLRRYSV